MYPYPIRLHGPWEVRGDGAEPRRMTMPALIATSEPATLVRSFGLPRTLDDFERVWLMAERVRGSSIWWLNGERLGECEGGRWEAEVTGRLRARNELRVEFARPDGEVGFDGEIALVIRCAAYLTELSAQRRDDGISVSGRIAGEGVDTLELYALADDRPCGYGRGFPNDRFEFEAQPTAECKSLRIDLVKTSTIWDTAIVAIE